MRRVGKTVHNLSKGVNNPRNGEGTFLRLKDGSIMHSYSRFTGDNWDDGCPADIAAVISRDEGETWGEPVIQVVHDENAGNVMCPSLLRMADGALGLFYLRKDIKALGYGTMYLVRSYDEGCSWSEPVCCTPDEHEYVFENDHILRLSDGRILLPVNRHTHYVNGKLEGTMHSRMTVFESRDDGATWQLLSEELDIPCGAVSETGLQESCIYELPEGGLVAYSRTDMLSQYRSVSIDGGKSWSVPVPDKYFSSPNSPLLIRTFGNDAYAVWNPIPNYNTRDTGATWGRTPMVLAVSNDGGRSFGTPYLLEDDPESGYCYPAIFDGGDYLLISYYHTDGGYCPLQACKIVKVMKGEIND